MPTRVAYFKLLLFCLYTTATCCCLCAFAVDSDGATLSFAVGPDATVTHTELDLDDDDGSEQGWSWTWSACHGEEELDIDSIGAWSAARFEAQLGRQETAIWDTEPLPPGDLPILPPPPPPLCHAFRYAHSATAAAFWRPRMPDLLPHLVPNYAEFFQGKGTRWRKVGQHEGPLLNRHCWRDTLRENFHESYMCLPEFSLLGFAKCGTSQLEAALGLTYNLNMKRKERRLFSLTGRADNITQIARMFQPEVRRLVRNSGKANFHGDRVLFFGDLTTVFLSHLMWPTVPPATVPPSPIGDNYASLTRGVWWDAMLPNQRYVVLVRDPVELMYSRFRHFHLQQLARQRAESAQDWGEELVARGIVTSWNGSVTDVSAVPELFDRVVRDEMRRMRRCVTGFKELHNGPELDMIGPQVSKSTHWDCIGAGDISTLGIARHDNMRSWDLLAGIYVYWLAWWMDVVGARDRTLVLRLEDFKAHPKGTALRVILHLGLPLPPDYDTITIPDKVRNSNAEVPAKAAPMLFRTRVLLEKFYAPYNAMLAKLVGDRRFNYQYAHTRQVHNSTT